MTQSLTPEEIERLARPRPTARGARPPGPPYKPTTIPPPPTP